jgi:hypothetical protein
VHLRGFILKYLKGFQMKHKKKWHFIQLVELNCFVSGIKIGMPQPSPSLTLAPVTLSELFHNVLYIITLKPPFTYLYLI